jgi:hypothetical protein
MGLNEKLRAMKEASRGKLAPGIRQIMAAALHSVEATGQHLLALKPGAAAPVFSLEDHTGRPWSSVELLAKGPLVVDFFRGSW